MELTTDDYTVGWICAIPIEKAAAVAILDEEHAPISTHVTDTNVYSFGRVGRHNVVIGCLPAGAYGTVSAANVAAQMRVSFPALRFGLMVGIGGGAPSLANDVRLGDIVVSQPGNGTSGIVPYDFGKTLEEGKLIRTGYLNAPPHILLSASSSLQATNPVALGTMLLATMQEGEEKDDRFFYPESDDRLFRSDYSHVAGRSNTCAKCDSTKVIARPIREDDYPRIHYGIIASGDQVMKDSVTRDKISNETGAICFEMEAAGLMNDFPCLIVRGICDYSDSHKNKSWQPYAAIVAAAYTKVLLSKVPIVSPTQNKVDGTKNGI
ncbi:hypothetical protein ABW20_dc0110180 [Dactylellina cionopaga]|nr:hypothetical protein ABW20_dc0110180 [Dactylellina cionopaga]